MSDPSAALQRASASALLAAEPVTALVGDRVRDELDGTGALTSPYIEFGAIEANDDSNQCSADKEMTATLHIWANGAKAKLVAMQVSDALTDVLPGITVPGYQVNDEPLIAPVHRGDSNGASAHSIVTVTYQLSPA